MIETTIAKELKRLLRLSRETYKIFGFKALVRESFRYLKDGPIEHSGFDDEGNIVNYEVKEYSYSEVQNQLALFKHKPLISVICPVYNVKAAYLDACIESVLGQFYSNWELCVYDDCSTNPETLACLKKWEGSDVRIKIAYGKENRHISFASNRAIENSKGSYIGLLDNDDELAPVALFEIVKAINEYNAPDFIYSDEDLISPAGRYFNPHYKSDFNRSLLLSHNYITHFAVIKRSLGDMLGWFREGYEGAQDHDLFLRIVDKTRDIVHIPKILYHWRQSDTSTSLNYNEKSYADRAARRALSDYAQRNGIEAELLDGPGLGVYRFKHKLITNEKVSIIIPFKDQPAYLKKCVQSILAKTAYPNIEVLLVSNNSTQKKTFKCIEQLKQHDSRIKVLEYNVPFNFSRINNWAVKQADGEYILLLNNDVEAISEQWLEAMLEHIQQNRVGVVGAKLLYPDKTIQHAGVIIGILGVAGHSHRFCPDTGIGYYYRPVVIQDLSAVTGACLLTRRSLWNKVGGLNEKNLKIAFNDIDYCLKIRKLGYDVVYTPYAKLLHYESKSRGLEDTPEKRKRFMNESYYMKRVWKTHQIPDPFYNVNLSLNVENFKLK